VQYLLSIIKHNNNNQSFDNNYNHYNRLVLIK